MNNGRYPLGGNTHILVSFAAEPPAIFCTRRPKSSVFSSVSCFDKSFLDLDGQLSATNCRKLACIRTWTGARTP